MKPTPLVLSLAAMSPLSSSAAERLALVQVIVTSPRIA